MPLRENLPVDLLEDEAGEKKEEEARVNPAEIDLLALAEEVVTLLRHELRLENERRGRHQFW